MNTTNAAVGTGVLVTVGRWSEGDGLSIRVVVGVLFLAVFLSVLPEKIAQAMAYLILTAATFRYAPGIITKTGIGKAAPKAPKGSGPDAFEGTPGTGAVIGV